MKHLNSNNNDEDILFIKCNEFYNEIKKLKRKNTVLDQNNKQTEI
jgi:hypothetical protein